MVLSVFSWASQPSVYSTQWNVCIFCVFCNWIFFVCFTVEHLGDQQLGSVASGEMTLVYTRPPWTTRGADRADPIRGTVLLAPAPDSPAWVAPPWFPVAEFQLSFPLSLMWHLEPLKPPGAKQSFHFPPLQYLHYPWRKANVGFYGMESK